MSNHPVKYTSPTKSGNFHKTSSPKIPIINTSRDTTRRAWIKRPGGNATSLYIKDNDIVDDLKSMVAKRFPTTLAKESDPADIIIKLDPSVLKNAVDSPKLISSSLGLPPPSPLLPLSSGSSSNGFFNSPISPIPVSIAKQSSLVPKNSSFEVLSKAKTGPQRVPINIGLNPEAHVWSILDKYFPNGMTSDNAFIVEAPITRTQESPLTATDLNNRKSYPSITEDQVDEDSTYDYHTRRMNSLPGQSYFNQSPNAGTPNSIHRRSQSNPAEPSSAVLLLPKDFATLSENNKTKSHETVESRPGSVTSLERTASPASTNGQHINGTKLTLPTIVRENSSTKRKDEASTMAKVLPSVSVLVVEDNLINLRILSAHLRRHRIHHDVAKNGQEAIDKWRNGRFHLVLMDIQLPVISGLEATKEIRRLEKINGIGVFANSDLQNMERKEVGDNLDVDVFRSPVIIVALTASNLLQDKQEALAVGCNDYLTKPVNLDWLLNKITEWGCMQALIDFDGWKSGERMTNISAAIPTLTRSRSSRRTHNYE